MSLKLAILFSLLLTSLTVAFASADTAVPAACNSQKAALDEKAGEVAAKKAEIERVKNSSSPFRGLAATLMSRDLIFLNAALGKRQGELNSCVANNQAPPVAPPSSIPPPLLSGIANGEKSGDDLPPCILPGESVATPPVMSTPGRVPASAPSFTVTPRTGRGARQLER